MFKLLNRANHFNANALDNKNHDTYKNKVFQKLCFIALIALVSRFIFLSIFNTRHITTTECLINSIPLVLIGILFTLIKFNKFSIAKIVGVIFIPLTIISIAVFYQDKSMLTLVLLFCITSFILYDKITFTTYNFIYNAFLYVASNIYFFELDTKFAASNSVTIYILNHLLFFFVFYYVLIFLKNSFNHYFKNIYNDNEQLNEMNTDLLNMHNKLVEKNKKLEQEQNLLTTDYKKNNQLFSIISHDVKGPLISVKNILEYTKDDESNNQIKDFIPEIRKTINNTVGLLENLLVWSKSKESNLENKQEVIHLNGFMEKIIDLYSISIKSKNVMLEVQMDNNLFVLFNKDMLHTVLRNLVSNAIKYSVHNGTVIIKAIRKNGKVEIDISNTAHCVNEEQINWLNSNMETPLNTAQNEIGSGLGLMIVKDFLRKNNAPIQYSNVANKYINCTIEIEQYSNQILKAISSKGIKEYLVASR